MSSPDLAVVVVGELLAAGVRHVVACPGSRNAPLLIALGRAEADGLVRLHVRVDERVAGFTALGLGKGGGAPVAVVTTSGTATGNLTPAVMEAHHAGVPLVVVTADRPLHQIGVGANQTADQSGLFAGQLVDQAALTSQGGPATAVLRRLLASAGGVRTRRPGPVHLNLHLDVPLVDADLRVPAPGPRPLRVGVGRPGEALRLPPGPRTVVMVGDADPATGARARACAEAAGVPLLAEPSSNARSGRALSCPRLVLDRLGERVERVLVFGHPTLSRATSRLLAGAGEVIVVADRSGWFDPAGTATAVVDDVDLAAGDSGWLRLWQETDRELADGLAVPGPDQPPSGTALAAAVVAAARAGQNLVLGASSTIRDAALAPVNHRPATVWANRGLAGIDGTVATASGIALSTGAPTTVLLGDLTLVHDLGALVPTRGEPAPRLRIVVADDSGGSIFHTLEQGAPDYADVFERVFATPLEVDLSAAAAALGATVRTPGTMAELTVALDSPIAVGIEVVHVRIDRSQRVLGVDGGVGGRL